MRLLIVTQAVDLDDPILGFFHAWIAALAKRYERISVICLKEGRHSLPDNVRVFSLGKEKGRQGRGAYTVRFLSLAWRLRRDYDAVLVHMNQEYVLIGGLFWKMFGKRIYLWRNHYKGDLFTSVAAALSDKVFCTSRHSYTARFRKTVIMPVGVDTDVFKPSASRAPGTILSLGRISPSKQVHVLIEALKTLKEKGVPFSADIYGDALPKDASYLQRLRKDVEQAGLSADVRFSGGIPHDKTPPVYASHEVFVNLSPSGMLDKTIFEACASGCLVLAASDDFRQLAGDRSFAGEGAGDIAAKIRTLLELSNAEKHAMIDVQQSYADSHSLASLIHALENRMT